MENKLPGDEIAQHLENNEEEWETVSEEEQNKMRSNLKLKEMRVSIRISSEVLDKLRAKAAKEGLAYQTYINSILFKVANNDAEDVEELRKRISALEEQMKALKGS